jgi:transcriptional regulator with XRE-family HTH domain
MATSNTKNGQCLTPDEFIAFLRKKQGSMTQQDFAQAIGVSQSYLSDIYQGRRSLQNDEILAKLGVKREYHFVRL